MNLKNETLRTISTRATSRAYTGDVVSKEDLDAIIEAGLQSPSAYNKQPWQIIAVTNADLIARLEAAGIQYMHEDPEMATALERIKSRGGKLLYNAPVVIYIATVHDLVSARDCGIVVQSMALAATSLGLGNCICGLGRLPLLGAEGEALKKELQFPEGYDFGCALLVGTSTTTNEPHKIDRSKATIIA